MASPVPDLWPFAGTADAPLRQPSPIPSPSPSGRRSPWHVPRGPPVLAPTPPLPVRYSSPVVMHRPPLCDPLGRDLPVAWPQHTEGRPPSVSRVRYESPVGRMPVDLAYSIQTRPSCNMSDVHTSNHRRQTWIAFVADPAGWLWFDDHEAGYLCSHCTRKLDRAYDAPFQLSMRIKREQLVHGALQNAIESLRSLCMGDVSLEEVLGQHWAQMKLQYDIINILLEAPQEQMGASHLQEIKNLLADFKRASVARMEAYRTCPVDGSWERMRLAMLAIQEDNRRLLEDVEMLHSANTLLESDVGMLSAELERCAKKRLSKGEASDSATSAATTDRLRWEEELNEAHGQRRRVEQERDVLELENQRLTQDLTEAQKRADELWRRLKKAEVDLLTASPLPSPQTEPTAAVQELQVENDILREQARTLKAEIEHLKARGEDGTARLLVGLDNGLRALKEHTDASMGTADASLQQQLEAERALRARIEQRLTEDGCELDAVRQEATKAQMACMHLADALRERDAEVQSLKDRLGEATINLAKNGESLAADVLTMQKSRDLAVHDASELRSRCSILDAKVVVLQGELKSARRASELHSEQLTATLGTLAEKETLLAECQAALQQAQRSTRDLQGEQRALLNELQVRRSSRVGSGRSTPVRGASPCVRCSSPAVTSSVAAILKGYRGPSSAQASGSDAGNDGPATDRSGTPVRAYFHNDLSPFSFGTNNMYGPPAPHVPSSSACRRVPLDAAEDLRSMDGIVEDLENGAR